MLFTHNHFVKSTKDVCVKLQGKKYICAKLERDNNIRIIKKYVHPKKNRPQILCM